jgi:RNA polymerase sigma-54 factor
MHESTISRVTTNKYIHTPQGVFELKFFFSSGLRSAEGEVSSESVKEKIRELVAGEDPKNPLSDQALCEKLQASGIDIARRTVAKYREMLNILSSSRRKKSF